MSAGSGCSGQRSAVSRLRGSGPSLVFVAPVLSPPEVARAPAPHRTMEVLVGGPGSAWGGRPAVLPPLPALIAWVGGARLSSVSSFVWGLGLRQR